MQHNTIALADILAVAAQQISSKKKFWKGEEFFEVQSWWIVNKAGPRDVAIEQSLVRMFQIQSHYHSSSNFEKLFEKFWSVTL